MRFDLQKVAWNATKLGATVATTMAIHSIFKYGYMLVQGSHRPPNNPESPDTSWKEALVWTLSTAVAVGMGRLVVRRNLAAGWHKVTGTPPPSLA